MIKSLILACLLKKSHGFRTSMAKITDTLGYQSEVSKNKITYVFKILDMEKKGRFNGFQMNPKWFWVAVMWILSKVTTRP